MRFIIYTNLFLLFNYSCIAQKYIRGFKNELKVPAKSWTFRCNVSNFIDVIEPNINFGAEYRVTDNFSIAADVGYIYYNTLFETKNNPFVKGIVFKPAARYYTTTNKRLFLEAELLYKNVHHNVKDWVGKNCVNNIPAYEEFKQILLIKNVYGFQAKIGRIGKLSKDDKFSIEYYFGLGLRYKKYKVINEPNSCYSLTRLNIIDLNSNPSEWALLPSMPLGFRLTYRL